MLLESSSRLSIVGVSLSLPIEKLPPIVAVSGVLPWAVLVLPPSFSVTVTILVFVRPASVGFSDRVL